MKSVRNNTGFSLVELMVVVAIIGILASIAIPSVNKYMAKARQTEAKTNLSSVYTAEKAFATEYNTYSTNFNAIGVRPEGSLRYNFGFNAAGNFNTFAQLQPFGYSNAGLAAGMIMASAICDVGAPGASGCGMLTGSTTTLGVNCATLAAAAVVGASTTFVANACGNISSNAAVNDSWTIDQNKVITNISDGTN